MQKKIVIRDLKDPQFDGIPYNLFFILSLHSTQLQYLNFIKHVLEISIVVMIKQEGNDEG